MTGSGTLPGITRGSTTSRGSGVDALLGVALHPRRLLDFGYDVSDYTTWNPMFGSMPDFDRVVAAAHDAG